ncbi:hypothetical protein CSB70_4252 (plasmid) [Acinetobacter baumannii]|nr:hypothetical protein CSB70_4169 [Acinetobacter baumannii]AVI35141.1 hypothetical protein CSB70_4185 [Acinetobacter baumannii]AVI35157.1 hypothetical protein CSB70_4201 [Acinetobacter baumannii]AVI35175.1 hypothetical protein CSB70_4219 [Acinetobacter baumannii]AVI35190.1 hypothetical protein CSB70_4234 [Acinetobacter baumannii]
MFYIQMRLCVGKLMIHCGLNSVFNAKLVFYAESLFKHIYFLKKIAVEIPHKLLMFKNLSLSNFMI